MKKTILLVTVFFCLKLTYSQPGQLDPFFGNKGIIRADLGAEVTHQVKSNKVIVRSDGSIYVLIETKEQTLVAKRKSDGTRDVTYGNKGFSVPITSWGYNSKMAMQSDGKILAGAQTNSGYDGGNDITIARYDADGSLDKTFGQGGMVTVSATGSYDEPGDEMGSLVVAPNGQIIVTSSFRTYDNEWNELDHYYINYLNSNGSINRVFTAICGNNLSIQADGKLLLSGGYSDAFLARYNPDGSLDTTFDNDGKLLTGFPETSMCIASDGKIVLGGQYEIRRYTPSGKLDLSFSGDGRLQVPFKVNSIIPFIDGKIGVAGGGMVTTTSENFDFAIARYTSAGALDNTFSADGIDIINLGGNEEASSVSKINGKMVIVGTTSKGLDGFGDSFSIARYNIDGSLDNTFDVDGILAGYLKQGNTVFNGVAVQPDGKTVSVGLTWNGRNNDFVVERHNTNGSLDNTFSSDGKLTTDFGGNEGANGVVIQTDGKIVVAGGMHIVRYNPDGSLDPTFSGDGKQTAKFNINKIAIQSNNKIVVCGSSIARYKTDGTLDATFAGDGDIVTPFICNDVAIQADGKIVVTGGGRDYAAAVARYHANGYPDNGFGVHSLNIESYDDIDPSYSANTIAIQSDGKILAGGHVNGTEKGTKDNAMLFRFLPDGNLDNTFGEEGKIVFYSGSIKSIATQTDGKILVAGITANDYGQGSSVLLRLNTNGSFDATFNGATYHISGAEDAINEVVIYKDKATAVGYGVYPGLMGHVMRVLLAANKPPVVSITSPANNAVYYAPATINISVTATDADGKISSVKFYKGTTLLTTDYSYPYTYSWSNVPAGTYYLTAKATDNFGLVTTSAVVKVTVMASNSIASSKPSSINDQTDANDALSMRLSPNPTSNTLQIFTKGLQLNKPSSISVISASGVVMKTIQSNASNKVVQLDVSSLVSGVYTIKVISGDKVMYKRFVRL